VNLNFIEASTNRTKKKNEAMERIEEIKKKNLNRTLERVAEVEKDKFLETSLPFDKYKDKEYLERQSKVKLTNMFNVKQVQMRSSIKEDPFWKK
jgi:hypothetical protein